MNLQRWSQAEREKKPSYRRKDHVSTIIKHDLPMESLMSSVSGPSGAPPTPTTLPSSQNILNNFFKASQFAERIRRNKEKPEAQRLSIRELIPQSESWDTMPGQAVPQRNEQAAGPPVAARATPIPAAAHAVPVPAAAHAVPVSSATLRPAPTSTHSQSSNWNPPTAIPQSGGDPLQMLSQQYHPSHGHDSGLHTLMNGLSQLGSTSLPYTPQV